MEPGAGRCVQERHRGSPWGKEEEAAGGRARLAVGKGQTQSQTTPTLPAQLQAFRGATTASPLPVMIYSTKLCLKIS